MLALQLLFDLYKSKKSYHPQELPEWGLVKHRQKDGYIVELHPEPDQLLVHDVDIV